MPNEIPAGEKTPEFVNTWKPVTDLYHDTDAPAVAEPPPIPVAGATESRAAKVWQERRLPIPIAIVGGFYALRALVFLVFASILGSHPDSQTAALLIEHSRSLIPFAVRGTGGQPPAGEPSYSADGTDGYPLTQGDANPHGPANLLAEAMVVTAILSTVVSVMWFVRYWRIRWITMFYAGVSLFRTVLYFVTDKAAGIATVLTPDQKQALTLACAVNLFVFCYLAFYPGVAQAFEERR